MATTKKKSKSVLERIGDAVTTGAEAVLDAGSKAIHSVGDMMPTGKETPVRKASPKKSAKVKSSKVEPKATVKKPVTTADPAKPKVKESASPAKAEKVTAKAAPSPKGKRASKKG